MANKTHSTITDPDLHEPKGVSTAVKGRVYQTDGAGSGSWKRPLVLVTSGDDVSGTSVEITGLSEYRELIVIIEASNIGTSKFFNAELYSTSAAAWRTTASNYDNGWNGKANDHSSNISGLLLGVTFSSRPYFSCISRITNFNSATEKTSLSSGSVAVDTYFPTTGTVPTSEAGITTTSVYQTAEAHEGIRLRNSDDSSFSGLYYSVWGIKS